MKYGFARHLALCLASGVGVMAGPAYADLPTPAETQREGLVRMGDVGSGTLLLEALESGLFVEAPMVATDVDIDVTGPVVRARVTQRFENPSDQWVEGVYVFPLPDGAGVDRLRILIGDRAIEGEIRERQEARRIYEEARSAGVRASLVEQERPNMFTNSVANIGPGETVVVQIEYQDQARLVDGAYELRFPMVVGPRYVPAPRVVQVADAGAAPVIRVNDPVPDAARITPPTLRPEFEPADTLRLPVTLSARLNAGFTLGEVASPYHAVFVDRTGPSGLEVNLADGAVPANRDFVLTWRAADPDRAQAALFHEERDGEHYLLAMVSPPTALSDQAPRRSRETIFVIDNSGSMAGDSIAQARQALLLALERLDPGDLFNIVRFDDTMELVFPQAVPASADNVAIAVRFVAALEAQGGTEMLPALRAALVDATPQARDRIRQVVFLTDGAIGNEAELFQAIDDGLGRSRLFTIGIGSAPNTYFMSRAARIGRGTFTHIGDVAAVQDELAVFFQALERPVMSDLAASFPDGALSEIWPDPLPDLYFGEPVTLTARVSELAGDLTLSGRLADRQWSTALVVTEATSGPGVAALWARSRIAAAEESRFTGADQTQIDRVVLQTALDFSLVSRLTSLVAVDRAVARPVDANLERRDIATMLPEGWDFDAVFGPDVQPLDRQALLDDPRYAALKAMADAETNARDAGTQGLPLPRGGTLSTLLGLLGAALIAVGVFIGAGVRRRRPA